MSEPAGKLISFRRRDDDALYDVTVHVLQEHKFQVYGGSVGDAVSAAGEATSAMFPENEGIFIKETVLA
jgi:hypothetical protein